MSGTMNEAAGSIGVVQPVTSKLGRWTNTMRAADRAPAMSAAAEHLRSFEELVERHSDGLLRFFRQRLGRAGEAEDLLQETFLRAYLAWRRVDRDEPLDAWIFTIGYRVMVSHGRRRWLRAIFGGPEIPEAADPAAEPGAVAAESEERGRVWQVARQCLNTAQFTALWLHYGQDLPAAEIATVLGRSENAVRILLHRSRERLRTRLERSTRSDT